MAHRKFITLIASRSVGSREDVNEPMEMAVERFFEGFKLNF